MAQQNQLNIQFPVGRIVAGSLYKARDKDAEGRPLLIRNGPDAGKQRVDYFFAVAIPKVAGHTHWAHTDWGQKIWALGHQAFPQAAQSQGFAWKIEDGDSQVPNRKDRKPSDNEGWPGHWVVKFGGGYAPKVWHQPQAGQFVEVTQPDLVKCGYWVAVSGSVAGNGSSQRPGIYINHGMVLFARADAEIVMGPDPTTAFAGYGVSAALPAMAPSAGAMQPPAMQPPAMQPPAMQPPPAPGVAVAPNPAFMPPPVGAPAAPGAVPPGPPIAAPAAPPPMAAGPQLTAKGIASGFTYAQYRTANWTDDALRANGLIV